MAELRKYLRDKNGNPCGVLIALGKGQVGWSVVHPQDSFDKELGVRIARGRAAAGTATPGRLPNKHLTEYQIMEERASRYFK